MFTYGCYEFGGAGGGTADRRRSKTMSRQKFQQQALSEFT
jgi:hypothetical protein